MHFFSSILSLWSVQTVLLVFKSNEQCFGFHEYYFQSLTQFQVAFIGYHNLVDDQYNWLKDTDLIVICESLAKNDID